MMRILVWALFIAMNGATAISQVGQWRTYTAMHEIRAITAAGGVFWAATSGGVFSYDPASNSYQRSTNVEGLTDIDVTAIASDASGRIVCGSSNGSVNVHVPGQGWYDVPDIRRATDKPKRGVRMLESRGADILIGTDFGIATYRPDRKEFGDTYQKFGELPAQIGVNDIAFLGDSIWVATDQGVAATDMRRTNLQDPSAWIAYQSFHGLPSGGVACVANLAGTVIAGTARGVYALSDGFWTLLFPDLSNFAIKRFHTQGTSVFAVTERQIFKINSLTAFDRFGDETSPPNYPSEASINDLTISADGRIAIATAAGFSFYSSGQPWQLLKPNGPTSNRFLSLAIDEGGLLWACSGGEQLGVGMYSWDGNNWTNYHLNNEPNIKSDAVFYGVPGDNGSMLFSVWGPGVVRRDRDGRYTAYTKTTTPDLPVIGESGTYSVLTGMAHDAEGNVWFSKYYTANGSAIACMRSDGTWREFTNPALVGKGYYDLVIDEQGNKWIRGLDLVANTTHVVMFNENGTFDNTSDDHWFIVDSQNMMFDGKGALSIAVDHLGDLWIGGGLGLRTIYDAKQPEKVYRTCYNTRCNIEGQKVNCIAVDCVDNKWLGTSSGIFVLSPDGSTIIEQYTVDNSPLLGNEVTSIAIHPITGTAYFATPRGLSSMTTPYACASQIGGDGLRLWPNPFHPGEDERLTVDGLAEGSTLKILTASGILVNEVATPGGRVGYWDGRTKAGDLVPSGVYFVVAYGSEGRAVQLTKLAVVRR
jgi:ligand-binding sensor domain-containing protein